MASDTDELKVYYAIRTFIELSCCDRQSSLWNNTHKKHLLGMHGLSQVLPNAAAKQIATCLHYCDESTAKLQDHFDND